MQKYKAIPVFLKLTQIVRLRAISKASHEVKNPAQTAFSVSKLVRLAVQNLIESLEEWEDAIKYQQTAHKDMPKAPAPSLNGLARVIEMSERA